MVTINDLNRNLIEAQYAVRGKIVIRAQELEEQGKKIIYCNIGNPQALKQKPLTYIRQMIVLLEYPELLNNPEILNTFPKDIIKKAKEFIEKNPVGLGAYSQSAGIPFIRQAVADFITKRDSIPADKAHIVLTDGASKGVSAVIPTLIKNANDGFMIPIPQYPLYSAAIRLYGAQQIGYYLDENNSWQLNEKILTESIEKAKENGINPVSIAVINPGNPTGAVLSKDNIEMVIRFAKKNNLSIMADEVYQENVYIENLKFYSFAKVMYEMNEKEVTLFSFHSVSKGFMGECGHRGGYLELRNLPDDVMEQFIKLQSISLCSNLTGQVVTYMMVSSPRQGDESYDVFIKERDNILFELRTKSRILGTELNKVKGMITDIPQGAMYAFVKIDLPDKKGVDTSKMSKEEKIKYEASKDADYCMSLLEDTGICVVPGSGFGQLPATYHFRTTFLPPRDEMEDFVKKIKDFHSKYVESLLK
jgi:aspartate/methionine/tyrosine aminotransferase